MKLLKFSIFLTFILSLLSAGLTFYLSNVRENEKEKRLYLEGVRTKLESEVQSLQAEVDKLGAENKGLQEKLREEEKAKEQVLALMSDRDSALKQLEEQAQSARQSFEDAQKRNQELEKILDELETRMQQMETQATPNSEIGVVGLQVVPPSEPSADLQSSSSETVLTNTETVPEPVPAPEPEVKEVKEEESVSSDFPVTPITEAPKPPKKRRFFGLLGSKSDKKESKSESAPESKMPAEETSPEPALSEPAADSVPTEPAEEKVEPAPTEAEESKSAPEPEKTEVKSEQPQPTSQQTIAAGNVLLVNRVHNFAVVNLGSRHGLTLNDILNIQRDGAQIAKVRVEKLYEDYCAAYIVEEQSGKPIQEGDVAGAA